MPANRRIYYAIKSCGLAQDGTTAFTALHGVTTGGINTRYNLSQSYEFGQLSQYENIEDLPDVEISLEKYLDGWPLIYHLATLGSASSTLAGRSNPKATFAMSIYPDTNDNASGNPIQQMTCSGMFTQQISYSFPTEDFFKESVTLVGNNKQWLASGFTFATAVFTGTDAPWQTGASMRRQNILFQPANPTGSAFLTHYTKFPTDIPGISSSGTNDLSAGDFGAHVQSIRVSANLGRDQLLELGRRGPYFRYVNFPVEVRTDYDVISLKGDLMSALENNSTNVNNQTMTIKVSEGTYINLGTKNKCTGVNFGGGNAGQRGGNDIMSFSYVNFNDMIVIHPQDPSGFSV